MRLYYESLHGMPGTSAELAEPPAHVYPPSMVAQSAEQPSRASWLPSSHTSPPARSPSPHTVTHASMPLKEPPEHDELEERRAALEFRKDMLEVLLFMNPSKVLWRRLLKFLLTQATFAFIKSIVLSTADATSIPTLSANKLRDQ